MWQQIENAALCSSCRRARHRWQHHVAKLDAFRLISFSILGRRSAALRNHLVRKIFSLFLVFFSMVLSENGERQTNESIAKKLESQEMIHQQIEKGDPSEHLAFLVLNQQSLCKQKEHRKHDLTTCFAPHSPSQTE